MFSMYIVYKKGWKKKHTIECISSIIPHTHIEYLKRIAKRWRPPTKELVIVYDPTGEVVVRVEANGYISRRRTKSEITYDIWEDFVLTHNLHLLPDPDINWAYRYNARLEGGIRDC